MNNNKNERVSPPDAFTTCITQILLYKYMSKYIVGP